ncbi:hypothetical protein TNCV_1453521 [Trichonephila clavipes]|nr:hypothetical protein TNCV_1453521 [Trichonephila clavipes]
MIVQFRNEKVSNHGSIPITIDCNVVAFIVFEEGFHQPIKRKTIVRVQYFVRGGSVGHRSRASSKHLSPHLPVDELDSSGGSNRGCAAPADARVGVGSTKKAD